VFFNIAVLEHKKKPLASTYSPLWAMLLGKIFEINPLLCPSCGGEMKMIAFVTDTEPIRKNITSYRGARSCAVDFPVSRPADILCRDRSNAVLGW